MTQSTNSGRNPRRLGGVMGAAIAAILVFAVGFLPGILSGNPSDNIVQAIIKIFDTGEPGPVEQLDMTYTSLFTHQVGETWELVGRPSDEMNTAAAIIDGVDNVDCLTVGWVGTMRITVDAPVLYPSIASTFLEEFIGDDDTLKAIAVDVTIENIDATPAEEIAESIGTKGFYISLFSLSVPTDGSTWCNAVGAIPDVPFSQVTGMTDKRSYIWIDPGETAHVKYIYTVITAEKTGSAPDDEVIYDVIYEDVASTDLPFELYLNTGSAGTPGPMVELGYATEWTGSDGS